MVLFNFNLRIDMYHSYVFPTLSCSSSLDREGYTKLNYALCQLVYIYIYTIFWQYYYYHLLLCSFALVLLMSVTRC